MVVIKREATLLVVTEKGHRQVLADIDEYRVQKRGGKGIITVNRTEKTGDVVALHGGPAGGRDHAHHASRASSSARR